jgi:peroxiredoxin Q/BCP
MTKLQPGQPAPDFELSDQRSNTVRLSSLRGLSAVVLFFYPKDDTSGCTREACGFRDDYARFQNASAQIFGISSDSVDSHARFAAKFRLPYQLLSDPKGRIRKLYGATGMLAGLIPARVTFVIDRDGIIRHIYSSQSQFQQHVTEALAAIDNGASQ